MPLFIYSAAKQNGEIVKGEREAENEKTLARSLKQEGLFLLEVRLKGGVTASGLLRIDLGEIVSRLRPIGVVDKMFFARNLAVMISAGLPLTRSLDSLSQETTNHRFKKVLADITNSVVKGTSFAESLRMHPEVFSDLFINMIEVGETTGKLTLILKLLANQMKKDYDLKKRVRGAMIYPGIIISTLFGIGAFMMIYIVPTLAQTVQELGVELPLSTQIIIFISDILVHYAFWVFALILIIAALFWRAIKTEQGKALFDRVVLKLPIFGSLVKKFNLARFARTLAYLVASGVTFVHSLEITSRVLGNTLFRKAVEEASVEIQKGKQLNGILALHPHIFQPMVTNMIKVGEETGKISSMLLRLALFFEEDVGNTTRNLSSVIEPVLMILIGIAVGFFALAMLQPIYGSLGSI